MNSKSCKWEHPYLIKQAHSNLDEDRKGGASQKTEGLNIFPGTSVYAAGTSQICSQCGRNPIKGVPESKSAKVDVDEDGHVILQNDTDNSGEIQLFSATLGYSEKEKRKARHHKKHLPLDKPHKAGRIPVSKIISSIKFNMRRPQEDTRSKDTKQSIYHCVYTDCDNHMHADENAAINIGRRFLGEKIDRAQSRKKLGSWRKSSETKKKKASKKSKRKKKV